MILVAATAIACPMETWIARETDGQFSWSSLYEEALALFGALDRHGGVLESVVLLWGFFFLLLTPFAATWTIALALMQSSGRRRPLRRLASRPGVAAAIPAGIICACTILFFIIKYVII